MSPTIDEWPGKDGGEPYVVKVKKDETATLPLSVTPPNAEVTWHRIDDAGRETQVQVGATGAYTEASGGKSLVIAKVSDADLGQWIVRAKQGRDKPAEESFKVEPDSVAANDPAPAPAQPAQPGEWDGSWGAVVIVLSLALLAVFALAAWRTLASHWDTSRLPASIALLTAFAGVLALTGAIAAALLEIRGRMRARAEAHASTRGLGWPTAVQAKAVADLLKAYGGLTETAMLGATAIALLITASALAWHLPSAASPAKRASGKIAGRVTATVGTKCTIAARERGQKKQSTTLKPGRYIIVIKDTSKKRAYRLVGPGIELNSLPQTVGSLTLRVRLAKGSYKFACPPREGTSSLTVKE
jgi:uncharacterized integral membrane protein